MDVLELLAQQRSDNRAQFAVQQAARARVQTARNQQRAGTPLGFNADQGVLMVDVDGNAVPTNSLSSGQLPNSVVVSDSGGLRGWVDGISAS